MRVLRRMEERWGSDRCGYLASRSGLATGLGTDLWDTNE